MNRIKEATTILLLSLIVVHIPYPSASTSVEKERTSLRSFLYDNIEVEISQPIGVKKREHHVSLSPPLSGYTYYRNISIATGLLGDLTNYTMHVPLHRTFEYDVCKGNGGDIRVYDPDTGRLLSWERSEWNTSGTSHLWVKIPVIEPEDRIEMYYGKKNATDGFNAEDSWGSSALMIQHFNEGNGSWAKDSTSNNNDADLSRGTPWSYEEPLGGTIDFGNVDDKRYLEVPTFSRCTTNELTLLAWVYLLNGSTYATTSDVGETLVSHHSSTAGEYGYEFVFSKNGTGTVWIRSSPDGHLWYDTDTRVPFPVREWFHLGAIWTPTHRVLYINGEKRWSDAHGGINYPINRALVIGARAQNEYNLCLSGMVSEFQMYSSAPVSVPVYPGSNVEHVYSGDNIPTYPYVHTEGECLDPIQDPHVTNPVITKEDITDVPVDHITAVADPFIFVEEGDPTWHMFFEVEHDLDNPDNADIGYAYSNDGGLTWTYDQLVLNETWHQSFPYVFKWNGYYYMVPQQLSYEKDETWLYKASSTEFPTTWHHVNTLLPIAPSYDQALFRWKGKWWLFLGWGGVEASETRIFYSDVLEADNWTEHDLRPVIRERPEGARPSGRPIVRDTHILFYYMNNSKGYGWEVGMWNVTDLTPSTYSDYFVKTVIDKGKSWVHTGGPRMHHIDPWWVGGGWRCAVDSQNPQAETWEIGIFFQTYNVSGVESASASYRNVKGLFPVVNEHNTTAPSDGDDSDDEDDENSGVVKGTEMKWYVLALLISLGVLIV
ncbi:MAG: DUF2341 domain-containing protein, partial [Candidatus Korarchaeota archaeon]|nr:DUF2341 domain-containing protein [Candidatus Korarchaeota archaeon]NIU84406.1 DUF2341 domain-containing protein [Candidatus Thorarchaeota archaeon]NIW14515.1 DUF2341 domain-containing protein [Candidatus Thorarchaeota archaeon]NIW52594.1 DUF2341 domain-containing protein [Candidatus Korarchaeota archaeon]